MFLPNQARPVIRTRSASAHTSAEERIRPSGKPAKYMFECREVDIEVTGVDGSVSTDTQKLLAVNIPGTTNGWELTEFTC